MVHVPSQLRQRQNVVTVIVFAIVSMTLLLQNGQLVGRATTSELYRDSYMTHGASIAARRSVHLCTQHRRAGGRFPPVQNRTEPRR